ncbi:MAG: GIY-YIG nuclease family protein [Patescibacteria group bacterium]
MKEYIAYIVRCRDNAYYTGVTNDIERRMTEHNEGIDPTCYTYKRRPVELVYQCSFREVNDAINAEKQIKGWSRKKKEALIGGELHLLPVLSENGMERRIRSRTAWVRKHVRVMLSTVEACHHDATLRLGSG